MSGISLAWRLAGDLVAEEAHPATWELLPVGLLGELDFGQLPVLEEVTDESAEVSPVLGRQLRSPVRLPGFAQLQEFGVVLDGVAFR